MAKGGPLEPAAVGSAAVEALPSKRLLALLAAAAALYGGLAWAASSGQLEIPESVKVGVPFLFLPFIVLASSGQKPGLGKLDATFLCSAAAYVPFALWAAAAAPSAPAYYAPIAAAVVSFPAVLLWTADTFLHVGAVDYFTKRVVQSEAEARYGPWNALWVQLAAWCGGHVVEWFWLRYILSDVGAAAFLGSAGLVTGLAYMRWKNVLGLMTGHFMVNLAAATAAVAAYG